MGNENLTKPYLGPSFRQRTIAAHSFLHEQELKYRRGDRLYPFIAGDHFLNREFGDLGTIQKTIIHQIRKLAENPSLTRPVIYLDVGGGFGEASISIAMSLEDLITSGKAIVLVSNLEFVPKPEDIKMLKGKSLHKFFSTNMHRVHYVKSDVGHLPGLTIDSQNGPLKLFGNLDFIYECNALSHSRIPDRDFWILGRSLSQWGSLMFGSDEVYKYMEESDDLKRDIETSMQVGINSLRQMGLKESMFRYRRLFQRSDAPSLEEIE